MSSDHNNDGSGSNNSNNWLGFSLSPHMKMESSEPPHHHHHHHQHHQYQQQQHESSATAATTSNGFFLNTSAMYHGAFHQSHPFSVMPLKSDGSLCIMEALSRSEGMVPSSSPKLEDFLGGATMGACHQYGAHHHHHHDHREAMALSLDSIYYQNAEPPQSKPHSSLDLLHQDSTFGAAQEPHPHHHYYSGLSVYQTTPLEEDSRELAADCPGQIPQIGDLKNWVARHYSLEQQQQQQQQQQQMNGGGGRIVDHHDGGAAVTAPGAMGCGDLQSLSLSMSPGSQSSSCVTAAAPRQISPPGTTECGATAAMETKKRGPGKVAQKQPVHRKSIDTFGQRTSQYRGVTRHRWTGRYEAHLWDNSCKKEGQTRKGRQVYLGGYDMEDKAARAYDLAALKYWGPSTHINFPLENYQTELEDMKNMSRQEYVAHLRRKSSGFSRGASMYRGVTRHHQHGRWQARIGRVAGNKDLYLGTFSTQEEAAEAYDIAAIKFRGVNAVTNFDITRYDVERIMASNTLLAGELARRNKEIREPSNGNEIVSYHHHQSTQQTGGEANIHPESNNANSSDWKMALYQSQQDQQQQQQPGTCVDSLDQKSMSNAGSCYGGSSFSMALHDLIGIDSVNSSQPMMEEPITKLGTTAHFSNPSSLVTSLSSSREASPDKTGPAMIFAKPPLASKFISPAVTAVSSWFPTAQLRPAAAAALSMSHFPVFAAWNDT